MIYQLPHIALWPAPAPFDYDAAYDELLNKVAASALSIQAQCIANHEKLQEWAAGEVYKLKLRRIQDKL